MSEPKQAIEDFKEVVWDELDAHGIYKFAEYILNMIAKTLDKLTNYWRRITRRR